jgi:predicted lipoprotein with Yx(FWY)xxD motif
MWREAIMSDNRLSNSPLSRGGGRSLRICIAAAAATLALGIPLTDASATSNPILQSVNLSSYTGVLANHSARTLYVLSTERGANLHCKKACLTIWPPLLVKSSVKSIALGAGVKGKIGFVARSKTTKQVTFNSYPVYTYSGDTGPKQSHGEDVVQDGGTWTMLKAAAKTAGATTVSPTLQSENITNYSGTLANESKRSLYLLSTEVGASVQCTGSCLSVWFPLEVPSNTAPVTIGPKVDGTIGFVARGSEYQVTINSYPVYTYAGDSGAGQSNGEGVVAYGGTWYLLKSTSTSASGTPIPPVSGGTGPGY